MEPTTTCFKETKLCIIVDYETPIIMKVPMEPGTMTLRQFKSIASLHGDHYKFYFKNTQDAEFGVVKEEMDDDNSILPVDEDRIVAWVLSNKQNQSSMFALGSLVQEEDIVSRETMPLKRSSFDPPPPLPPIEGLNRNAHHVFNRQSTQESSIYIVKVQFHLNKYNFLGLTLVGPSEGPESTDHGIYVGEIARNSVVEQSGLVEVGDRIIEINGFNISLLNNDEAVSVFRQCVERRGAINLVLHRKQKCTQFNNRGRFTLPREFATHVNSQQQYRTANQDSCYSNIPIPMFEYKLSNSTAAHTKPPNHLEQHTSFARGTHSLPRSITPKSLYATSAFESGHVIEGKRAPIDSQSVYQPSTPTSLRQLDVALHCARNDIHTIYQALKKDPKSLDIKDREWLKMVVKDAFLGSALVKWLSHNVYGFGDKREIKRYANKLLTLGLIRNPITRGTFSEKCFYTLS